MKVRLCKLPKLLSFDFKINAIVIINDFIYEETSVGIEWCVSLAAFEHLRQL